MKYAWIERNREHFPVSLSCQMLGVSPSGYHEHRLRLAKPRRGVSNDALLVHVRAIHAESRGEYGWPRVWKELLARGIRVGKERVRKLMKLHGIRTRGHAVNRRELAPWQLATRGYIPRLISPPAQPRR